MPSPGAKGGNIRAGGATGSPLRIDIKVEGVTKAEDEFKRIRRVINTRLRDAMETIGQREVLPDIKTRLPRKAAGVSRGLPISRMADSMYVKRDRLDVVIASRLRGGENRALGWIDFGGKRPGDSQRRQGTEVIMSVLHDKQPAIRDSIENAVMTEFAKGFEVT